MTPDEDSAQRATAFYIAGNMAAAVEKSLTGTKSFHVLLFPDGYPPEQPAFVIEFDQSGLRYRVSVEPDGRREE